MRIDSDIVDIPSAGTAVQLLNSRDKNAWIKIKSLAANSGIVYVGDKEPGRSSSKLWKLYASEPARTGCISAKHPNP